MLTSQYVLVCDRYCLCLHRQVERPNKSFNFDRTTRSTANAIHQTCLVYLVRYKAAGSLGTCRWIWRGSMRLAFMLLFQLVALLVGFRRVPFAVGFFAYWLSSFHHPHPPRIWVRRCRFGLCLLVRLYCSCSILPWSSPNHSSAAQLG
jgi:hypothetical protein